MSFGIKLVRAVPVIFIASAMFKLNLKIAWRNLLKYRGYTLINVAGLSLGLAGFIFVLLFINHEKSYDTWDPKLENIYQLQEYSDYFPVETEFRWKDNIDRRFSVMLSNQVPEVKALTMVEKEAEKGITLPGKAVFMQIGLKRSDSLFFKVMPYQFKYGSSETAFAKPFSIVLKASLAQKYFKDQNPLGQTLIIGDKGKGSENSFTVTGVINDIQTPSVLGFNAIYVDNGADFRFGRKFDPAESTQIYVQANAIKDLAAFNKRVQGIYLPVKDKHLKQFNESLDQKVKAGHVPGIQMVKLADVHQNPIEGKSWQEKLSPVLLLSVLLLLVSIINFVNLATAQASTRAKEIGIKKVMGAQKGSLVKQFLIETCIQCLIALFIGLFLIELLLPTLNTYFSLELSLFGSSNLKLIGQLALLALLVAFCAGIYPSLFLSSYKPKDVLKGNFWTGIKGTLLRKGLVGLQFVITVSFTIGILFVSYQVNYLKTRDPGFSKTALLNVNAKFPYGKANYNELKKVDGVKYVGFSSGVIGTNQPSGTSFKFKNESRELEAIGLSPEGLAALDARLVAGRLFSTAVAADTISNVMINETAARLFATSLVGQTITVKDSIQLNVIGVVKDIQVAGFDEAVKPSVYVIQSATTDKKIGTYYTPSTLIKYEPAKLQNVIAALEKIFHERNSFYPLKYTLVEDEVKNLLLEHERFEKMVALFSFLSLALSFFGLFSLAAFITRQRTKEIAVRKVLGAAHTDILVLLNKGYIWIILAANAIAFPIAFILVNKWLAGFAYRINLTPVPFILAFLASVAITILTVSLQARRAVQVNPIKALKYE